MIRSILDANALLSGIVGVERETSTPGAIVRAWRARRFELVTSAHIRAEVERNLTHDPSFSARLTPAQVATNLESLAVDATQATITVQVVGVATHPEDDLVLAAAVSAGVDYLVTGDKALRALCSYQLHGRHHPHPARVPRRARPRVGRRTLIAARPRRRRPPRRQHRRPPRRGRPPPPHRRPPRRRPADGSAAEAVVERDPVGEGFAQFGRRCRLVSMICWFFPAVASQSGAKAGGQMRRFGACDSGYRD